MTGKWHFRSVDYDPFAAVTPQGVQTWAGQIGQGLLPAVTAPGDALAGRLAARGPAGLPLLVQPVDHDPFVEGHDNGK